MKMTEHPSCGDTKKITLPGGAEMEFAWCPPGTFLMGSPKDEEGRDDDETQHLVTLSKGFWLAKTQVTQRQWKSVMGSNPSRHTGDDLPVDRVNWNDCRKFCRKAGLELPTEAEWEYACRAGTTGAFAGNGRLEDMGWFHGNSGQESPHPVGQKRSNHWGLFDMNGNGYEWCADWYGGYSSEAVTDPTGPASGTRRVVRSGCYWNGPEGCRSASRGRCDPRSRIVSNGFRPLLRQD